MTKWIIFDLLHLLPCFPSLENCVDSWRWWQQEVDIPIQTVRGAQWSPRPWSGPGCYGATESAAERLGRMEGMTHLHFI